MNRPIRTNRPNMKPSLATRRKNFKNKNLEFQSKFKEPKYKIGDRVYSYANPDEKGTIAFISRKDKNDIGQTSYKISFDKSKHGTNRSKFIDESSISKRRTKEIKSWSTKK